jgi:hypothetical protein
MTGGSGVFGGTIGNSPSTGRLQAVDEVRRALRVAGRGKDRAVICRENVQPGGDVDGPA